MAAIRSGEREQTIVVQDTLAPILLAPPNRVVESAVAASPADVEIGSAVAFDLADPEPISTSTAEQFPVNSRTKSVGPPPMPAATARTKSQWVTIKTPGTNTPPMVAELRRKP